MRWLDDLRAPVFFDNVEAGAGGGGPTFASDTIGGIEYPRTKVGFGADNSYTDVSASDPFPVSEASGAAILAAAEAIQAAVEGTLIVNGSGVTQPVSGTVTATVTGVATAAKQDTIIGHVDGIEGILTTIDTDTGAIVGHVDGIETLLGTIDGRVDGIEALLTTIDGRVDGIEGLLTTIDSDTGTLAVTGNGTATGALRVTVASNSTGVIAVTDNGGSLTVDGTITNNPAASATGGWTPSKTISAASTNATSVKASAGRVGYIMASNNNADERYLKLYNKASAPTVGTDTPVHTFLIPGNTAGAGFVLGDGIGIGFSTGIAFALTTGVADSDTGAVGANEHVVNLGYS